jgi:hypothetical protein
MLSRFMLLPLQLTQLIQLKLKKEKSYGRSKRLLRSDGEYPNGLVW